MIRRRAEECPVAYQSAWPEMAMTSRYRSYRLLDIFYRPGTHAAVHVLHGAIVRTVRAARIVVGIVQQPVRDGFVIDADDDNGVRPDFLGLARETAVDFLRGSPVAVLQDGGGFVRTRGTIEQDFNIGCRREAVGLAQYFHLRCGTAHKNG